MAYADILYVFKIAFCGYVSVPGRSRGTESPEDGRGGIGRKGIRGSQNIRRVPHPAGCGLLTGIDCKVSVRNSSIVETIANQLAHRLDRGDEEEDERGWHQVNALWAGYRSRR